MTQRVDFSLILNGKSKVFIEVKRVGEELDHHQEQLLNYAFKEGFELSMPIIFIMLPLQGAAKVMCGRSAAATGLARQKAMKPY
jgi:hypothetical protein